MLNITRYAAQVNWHSNNILMDVEEPTSHDINNLYNLTTSLATSISFHQLILHIGSVFANLCDSLNYFQMVSAHPMDYINAATSGTLSPYILLDMDLQMMLLHISDTWPSTLYLPVSLDNTLHFYRYLCTHLLIEDKQFLLLIDVPIQNRSWQINMLIPVPLCKLLTAFLHWFHGPKWHFWLWGYHDNVQWRGYSTTWGLSLLRKIKTLVCVEHYFDFNLFKQLLFVEIITY